MCLDVDIAGAVADRLQDQRVDQVDDRRIVRQSIQFQLGRRSRGLDTGGAVFGRQARDVARDLVVIQQVKPNRLLVDDTERFNGRRRPAPVADPDVDARFVFT